MKKIQNPGCLHTLVSEFNQFKELDTEEEMECYHNYKKYGDKEAEKMLVESTTKKIMRFVLSRYQGMPEENMCDLIMEASVGVLDALRLYDEIKSNGAKFSTYAQYRARKELTAYLNRDCVIRKPEKSFKRANQLSAIEDNFYMIHGRMPDYKELSELSGFTEQQVINIKEKKYNIRDEVLSLDYQRGDDDAVSLLEMLAVNDRDMADNLIEKEMCNKVDALIEKLPERKKEILKMRYGMDDGVYKSGQKVGTILNTSRQYINASVADAFDRIRQYGADELAELDEILH